MTKIEAAAAAAASLHYSNGCSDMYFEQPIGVQELGMAPLYTPPPQEGRNLPAARKEGTV